jgi:hypothetical protein
MSVALDEQARNRLLKIEMDGEFIDVRNLLVSIVECAGTNDVEMSAIACKVLYNLLLTPVPTSTDTTGTPIRVDDDDDDDEYFNSKDGEVLRQVLIRLSKEIQSQQNIDANPPEGWNDLAQVVPQLLRHVPMKRVVTEL